MILYHYCSNHAFQSMVSRREIWLSSLSLSNDSMEGKWLRQIFREVCTDEKLDVGATKNVLELLEHVEKIIDGLGFCLSEQGDMLSQWRGYATDAAGVSIGFSDTYLEELSVASRDQKGSGFALTQIEYHIERQKSIVRPAYQKAKEFIDKGAFQYPVPQTILSSQKEEQLEAENRKRKQANFDLYLVLVGLFPDLFRLKNPAFAEECEWRLTSYFVNVGDDECDFRTSSDRIIPYRLFNIPEKENGPISEVVLGPKNITPTAVVESFLKQNGFASVKVVRSVATYR